MAVDYEEAVRRWALGQLCMTTGVSVDHFDPKTVKATFDVSEGIHNGGSMDESDRCVICVNADVVKPFSYTPRSFGPYSRYTYTVHARAGQNLGVEAFELSYGEYVSTVIGEILAAGEED